LSQPTTLKRGLSLPLLTFYGLGTIIGAGIYVLIGEVAGHAGLYTPIAFLLASLLAAFSAFSYAELSARFPVSAGEAVYLQHAFGVRHLSRLVGFMIVAIGLVSSATLVNGFVGYFQIFLAWPDELIITLLVVTLGGVAVWGITQSAWVAMVTTLVEIGGLLLVIWVARDNLATLPTELPTLLPPLELTVWFGVMAGAFVAFYAFIGFEDIVNVAEEVKRPTFTLPLAIILSLVISTLLYMVISVVAVLTVPAGALAGSEAPLALVYQMATGEAPHFITVISLAAVINGALIQVVMASRVLYGMAEQGWIPDWFGRVHPVTRTPLQTTLLVTAVILILALLLPLLTLANITSLITLSVFSLINLSLLRVKRRDPHPEGVYTFPFWLPLLGLLASVGMILLQLYQWL